MIRCLWASISGWYSNGVCPAIHGGMFNHEGGLIGAGMARVPMECFQKAMKAFAAKYRN